MIPLIVFFILLSVIGIFLWAFGKVKENTVAVIIFCSAIFCIVVPSLIQKTSLTYDKTPVENVEDKLFNVYSADGNVVVEAEENSIIEVYTLLGQHLVTVEAEAGFTSIPMVEANVVIVKVGNNVQKLVIK